MLTLHMRVAEPVREAPERLVAEVKRRLQERFNVGHATIEVEFERCAEEPGSQHGYASASGG
jgi:Co/Zn/Cd efflux system component